jgi:hypothetical protein
MRTSVNEENIRSRERLLRLEEDITRVPGVHNARVVGVAVPTKVHIVAGAERDTSDIVSDVRTVAEAGYGIRLDERVVSIVHIDPSGHISSSTAEALGQRPLIERVVTVNIGNTAWVKVALLWPDRTKTEGTSPGGVSRESRAKGAAIATAEALRPILKTRDAGVFIDHVVVQQVGLKESVMVYGDYHQNGSVVPIIGSALAHDDLTGAAVRALLQSINRKLEA